MAYDPQRDRPRHRPAPQEASAIDSLLNGEVAPPPQPIHEPAETPISGGSPEPANSWSDRLLYSAGISTVLGAAAAFAALWWLWRRTRR